MKFRRPRKKPEKPEWAEKWDALVELYPEGGRFEYLGIEMIVIFSEKARLDTHFSLYNASDDWYWNVSPILAEYVDGNGRIREKTFNQRIALSCLPNS